MHIRKREIEEIVYKIKRTMRNERERLTAVISVSQLTASHSCSNTVQCTERSPASINTIIKDSLTVRSVRPREELYVSSSTCESLSGIRWYTSDGLLTLDAGY